MELARDASVHDSVHLNATLTAGGTTDSLIIDGHAHYGKIAVDKLGFEDWLIPKIMPNHRGTTICAHAPSVVQIRTTRSVMIRGFINASGSVDYRNPIDFYVDHNLLGSLSQPCQHTVAAHLSPGTHRLEAYCATPASGRHSMWDLADDVSARPDEDTAVVTLAMYPADQIRNRLRLLQLSCRHHNIWLHVIGADEPFQHWYHSKVLRLKKAIDELPESIKYILYLDGVDTFVTAPLDHIRSGFAGCRRGVIVSAESCCWPCEAPEWKNSFSEKLEHRNFPCAGIWMAEHSSLMRTFAIMERVRSKLIGLQEPDSEIRHSGPTAGSRTTISFCGSACISPILPMSASIPIAGFRSMWRVRVHE